MRLDLFADLIAEFGIHPLGRTHRDDAVLHGLLRMQGEGCEGQQQGEYFLHFVRVGKGHGAGKGTMNPNFSVI